MVLERDFYGPEFTGHLSNSWRAKQCLGSSGWQASAGSRQGYDISLGKLGGYKAYRSRAHEVAACTNKALSSNYRDCLTSSAIPVKIAGQVLKKVGKLQARIDYHVLH